MNAYVEIAKMFKERNNKNHPGIILGKVISMDPLKIKINEKIVLDNDYLIIPEHLKPNIKAITITSGNATNITLTGEATLQGSNETLQGSFNFTGSVAMTANINLTTTLQINNNVIIMPSEDEQKYFVLGRCLNENI